MNRHINTSKREVESAGLALSSLPNFTKKALCEVSFTSNDTSEGSITVIELEDDVGDTDIRRLLNVGPATTVKIPSLIAEVSGDISNVRVTHGSLDVK